MTNVVALSMTRHLAHTRGSFPLVPRNACRHSGAGVLGTDQAPRGAVVSQAPFRGCLGEASGRGGQCPDLSTNREGSWQWSMFLSAQPSMGGRWLAGRGGTLPGDWTRSRAGSPKPHQVGDSRRALSVPAVCGRLPASPAPCLTARAPRLVSGSAIFTHYRSGC